MKAPMNNSETKSDANRKSEDAREASMLAGLWLEHPYIAHQKHEDAASAQELAGNAELAREHRSAATYWANKELKLNNLKYGNNRK